MFREHTIWRSAPAEDGRGQPSGWPHRAAQPSRLPAVPHVRSEEEDVDQEIWEQNEDRHTMQCTTHSHHFLDAELHCGFVFRL